MTSHFQLIPFPLLRVLFVQHLGLLFNKTCFTNDPCIQALHSACSKALPPCPQPNSQMKPGIGWTARLFPMGHLWLWTSLPLLWNRSLYNNLCGLQQSERATQLTSQVTNRIIGATEWKWQSLPGSCLSAVSQKRYKNCSSDGTLGVEFVHQ